MKQVHCTYNIEYKRMPIYQATTVRKAYIFGIEILISPTVIRSILVYSLNIIEGT